MKIAYQGIPGSYSESCAKENYSNCETISCKTFDECFELANNDSSVKAIIPESNKTTGNIGVEYLIFKYRLNIFAEHFYSIKHNLLGLPGAKKEDIKDVLLGAVDWGELDYLVLDLPPGTGDIQLALGQLVSITASVLVTTPQHISFIDVVKGVRMFDTLNVPTVAVVENMSTFQCSKCNTAHAIFDQGAMKRLVAG